jgi:hypothetical protein
MLELYQQVRLIQDVPDKNLTIGVVGTLIDTIPHPAGGERGCIIEVLHGGSGDSIVAVVPCSALEQLESR